MDQTLKTIVDFILSTRKAPPPDSVLDRCREILVDSLGCAIGGRNCIGAQVAQKFPAYPSADLPITSSLVYSESWYPIPPVQSQ